MTANNNRPTCESCPYWRQKNAFGHGQCRRKSPRYTESANNDWAITNPDEWCGDHPDMAAYIAGELANYRLTEAVMRHVPDVIALLESSQLYGNLSRKRVEDCIDNLRFLQTLASKEEETR